MPLPLISEVDIRRLAGPTIAERGRRYYRDGQVVDAVLRGDLLHAQVQGSGYDPYQVSIRFADAALASAVCSCPYDGAVCKHIAAVLFVVALRPEQVEERPPLDATLDELSAEQLRGLLLDVAAQHPDIAGFVEQRVAGLAAPGAAPGAPPAVAQQMAAIKQAIKLALGRGQGGGRYGGDWYDDEEMWPDFGSIDALAECARPYLAANDSRGAAQVLEALTSEVVGQLKDVDLYDQYYDDDPLMRLGAIWVEALLGFDLGEAERREWAKKLGRWQQQLEQYGLEVSFESAITAAREGWDTPALRQMMSGGSVAEQNIAALYSADDTLELARINALRRAGRGEEALNLARGLGRHEQICDLLLELGQPAEAAAYALQSFSRPMEALHLAPDLWKAGALAEACQIAAHGLDLPGENSARAALARYLRDWSAEQGDPAQALDAAITLLGLAPTLADYKRAAGIAPDRWPQERERALGLVRAVKGYGQERPKAEILLHEGDVDGAIAIADSLRSDDLIDLVARAATAQRPDWVIKVCTGKAAEIMDQGQSARYADAAAWLGLVRAAYLAAGRAAEWRLLLGQLLALHKRKYKLVPLLEAIK